MRLWPAFTIFQSIPKIRDNLIPLIKKALPALTNPHEADLSFCLAQFLDAQVFLGDTAVSGALVAPEEEKNLNHSKDS